MSTREHVLAKTYSKSKNVNNVYITPGNKYIKDIKCVNIDLTNFYNLYSFVLDNNIDLVVIGGEKYLIDGIVDYFNSKNILCFGPTKINSQLEGSKIFSKSVMKQYNLPTAGYREFDNIELSTEYINNNFNNHVIKYSGLAGGKGVFLPDTKTHAINILNDIFINNRFNSNKNEVLIEERLYGEEVSLLGFCNGKTISFMPQSQDYKKYYENDEGPNTGGMGSICPVNILNKEQIEELQSKVNNLVKDLNYKGLYILD